MNTPAPFFTVTDENTQHTNSRSKRYSTEQEALEEANLRLGQRPGSQEGVVIMRAIALVRPETDLDKLARDNGFIDGREMCELIAAVVISTPQTRNAFKKWQETDGTKAGILKLPTRLPTRHGS